MACIFKLFRFLIRDNTIRAIKMIKNIPILVLMVYSYVSKEKVMTEATPRETRDNKTIK